MTERNLVSLDDPDRVAELRADLVSDRLWQGEPALFSDIYAKQATSSLDRWTGKGLLIDPETLELFDPNTNEKVTDNSSGFLPEQLGRLVECDTQSPHYRPR